MSPRERQLAAIRHELSDRVSVDAICVENQAEIAAFLGVPSEQVLERLGLDGRIVSAGYVGPGPVGEEGFPRTEWGSPNTGDYGTSHAYPLSNISTLLEIEKYPWPDPLAYDYARAGQVAREWGERYALRGPYWKPLFCQVCSLFGLEEALVRLAWEPLLFEGVLEQVFQHTWKFCWHLLEACGESLPILCLGDDFATQRGLMISPEQWRKFLKPRYAQLFSLGKGRGKYVWFHSCGDITAVLPDLIDLGMDVWETVQLHTLPMSPEQLKREYGAHLTFFGGVNTQRLPFWSPEEVREEVIRCIKVLGKGGGYICGPDHHIQPDVPPANAVTLFETATTFRGEGYTQR
jgi:uroporphyrinogen decarboxylase